MECPYLLLLPETQAFSALERISEQGGRKHRLIFVPEFSGSAKEKPPLPEKAKAAIWSG